jgi:diguanylate cyclase
VQRELQTGALHDQLTGLANRRQLEEVVDKLVTAKVRATGTITGALVDLDNFKVINDTHGHRIGDLVLCEVGRRLELACQSGDLLVRLGGDEFVVVGREQTVDDVMAAAEQM